jgi:hypothetical protein
MFWGTTTPQKLCHEAQKCDRSPSPTQWCASIVDENNSVAAFVFSIDRLFPFGQDMLLSEI